MLNQSGTRGWGRGGCPIELSRSGTGLRHPYRCVWGGALSAGVTLNQPITCICSARAQRHAWRVPIRSVLIVLSLRLGLHATYVNIRCSFVYTSPPAARHVKFSFAVLCLLRQHPSEQLETWLYHAAVYASYTARRGQQSMRWQLCT